MKLWVLLVDDEGPFRRYCWEWNEEWKKSSDELRGGDVGRGVEFEHDELILQRLRVHY